MKNTLLALSIAVAMTGLFTQCQSSGNNQQTEQTALIPIPQTVTYAETTFKISQGTTIGLESSSAELLSIADYFNHKVNPALGYSLEVKEQGDIQFSLINNPDLGNEGYHLKVEKRQISIEANQPAGIFYGVQTLLQMLPKEIRSQQVQHDVEWAIAGADITDKPQFPWRGLMLDVSRHWFTKEEVMRFIDELAEYKMNVFHWHLTDDQGWRIEIKSLPNLTAKGAWRAKRVGQWWQREPQQPDEEATYGGYYTQEDIKDVLAYAKQRYVRVIPEIDVPGHSLATLVAYPELACMKAPKYVNVGNKFYGEDENTLCAGKEETFEFLDKVFTEVAALFPDEYIHVGGDECFKGFWHKCPRCQARMKAENLKDEK